MRIAFTHNLKKSDSEEEAEFDSPETVAAVTEALAALGHTVEPIDVSSPSSLALARLEAVNPDLVFNTAEGRGGRYREAFYPSLFEEMGLPFTGSDAHACAVTLDKSLTKTIVAGLGVPVARSRLVTRPEDLLRSGLRRPIIVKPNFEGSSKGISAASIVRAGGDLDGLVRSLLPRYPDGVLVEEFVSGRDYSVGFVSGMGDKRSGLLEPAEYLLPGEGPDDGFRIYDYHLKNNDPDSVSVRIPAVLPPGAREELLRFAGLVFSALRIRDFGRIDYRITQDGEIFFIEVNALPSLETGAGIFSAARAAGQGGVVEVIGAIVASAVKRYGLPLKAKPTRRKSVLRIGFAFNQKRVIPQEDPRTDAEVEFDPPSTLNAVREAIASYGHEVIDIEADADLPHRLRTSEVDFVFNIAEGIRGRNRESQVPAILELMGIHHTGSDAAAMALTLDKGLAKRIVREAGLKTAKFFLLITGREKIPPDMGFPMVVKPVAEGSSKGVVSKSVVRTEAELRALAAEIIGHYGQAAIAEEFLSGREFTVALLGERRPKVLPPMEIVFDSSAGENPIYSYQHKLKANQQIRYEAPAKIEPGLRAGLERAARRGFEVLGCRDVARMDFRLNAQGEINFMECNPLPGLTPGWSDLCLISESAGIEYRTLVGEIMAPAIRRFRESRKTLLHREAKGLEQTSA